MASGNYCESFYILHSEELQTLLFELRSISRRIGSMTFSPTKIKLVGKKVKRKGQELNPWAWSSKPVALPTRRGKVFWDKNNIVMSFVSQGSVPPNLFYIGLVVEKNEQAGRQTVGQLDGLGRLIMHFYLHIYKYAKKHENQHLECWNKFYEMLFCFS